MGLCTAFHRHGYTDAEVVWGIYFGMQHFWVISAGNVWDLTATQFGVKRKVFVISMDKAKHKIIECRWSKSWNACVRMEKDLWKDYEFGKIKT
jgi:hypothetical protein